MGSRKFITFVLLVGIIVTQSAFHSVAATFCNRAQFIADLSVPDGTSFAAGTIFTKSWRLKNIGTCTWTTGYGLSFASGEMFSAPAVLALPSQIAPGQTVDLSVNLTAPSAPGVYRGFWKLSDAAGTPFGIGSNADGAFWVEINVQAASAVAYDLVAFAPYAQWKSGAGALPYPGTSGDYRGYAQTVDSPRLEDGTIQPTPGLLTVPQNKYNGLIQAVYPEFTVQKGDRFQAVVGCEFGASCYVVFHLDYMTSAGRVKTFWTRNEQNDRRASSVNLDLSSLAGQNVRFILTILASGSPQGDRAVWGSPRIVRPAATEPPTPIPFPNIPPTPTPFNTPPPVVPSGCDRAAFIGDVTVPDNTLFTPGAAFSKTWRLKNIGSCIWTTEYRAIFHSGAQMGAPNAVNLPFEVRPGATVDLTINMVAPAANGAYRGNWILSNPAGSLFGISSDATMPFWLQVNVSGESPVNTGYDFTANACAAEWQTASGILPCPGIDADIAGFVIKTDMPRLEDGSTGTLPGLLMAPQFKYNGYIRGIYPAFTVQPGDRFQTTVGCEFASNCYVTFRLDYMTAAGSIPTFWTWREQNEGRFYNADIDLTPLAGQSVRFILTVLATGLPYNDRTVWGAPRISRLASSPPVTVTPPSPTATETLTPTPVTPTPTTPPIDDWLDFTNQTYGFQFKYPRDSQIENGSSANFTRIQLPFQQGTNLTEKYLDMHVVENADPCRSPVAAASIVHSSETVTINGIPYLKETGGDAGVGHLHEFVAYSTPRGSACVSLSFVLHSLHRGNFATPPPEFDKAAESAVFALIMSTLGWQPVNNDWLTYTNPAYGFEFRYPPQAQITGQEPNSLMMTLPFTAGTNLREKYLDLRVIENASPCRSPFAASSMVTSSETVTINSIQYLKETGEDGGAGNLHQWVAYSTARNNACVSLSFMLHSLNPGNFPTPPPVFDIAAESAVFGEIVSTYKWLAPSVPLPDLTVTAIRYELQNPACLAADDPLGVRLVIANSGQAAAGSFTVRVNTLEQTVSGLGIGETTALFFITSEPGFFSPTTVMVDSTNLVAESDESNNSRTETLPVPTPPLPCATDTPTPTPTPTGTPEPSPTAMLTAIVDALNARNFDAAKTFMSQSFGMAFWQSEGTSYPPDAAIEQLRINYLSTTSLLSPDAGKDLTALLDGLNPYAIMGLDPAQSQALFVSGWGLDGKGEAILYVTRRSDGSPYWHSVLIAPGGFVISTTGGSYAVVRVAWNDMLNIRSDAGTNYPVVGSFPRDATDIKRTGASKMVADTEWVQVKRLDGGTGWVNSYYLTEHVTRDFFCADLRVQQSIDLVRHSINQSDGGLFASLISPKHGVEIQYWQHAPGAHYTRSAAQNVFADTAIIDWGAGPSLVPDIGTFAQIIQPDLRVVFNSNYELKCDDPSYAYMFSEPWPHTNIHYYSVLKPPTPEIVFDWKVWLLGFEYVDGTPYLYGTVHYVWEP